MFTWICPQCGRECAPSLTECPDCVDRAKAKAGPAQAPVAQYPAATAPVATVQPAALPPPPVAPHAAVIPGSAPKSGVPTLLLVVLFAAVFGGIFFGAYYFIERKNSGPQGAAFEQPPMAREAGAAKADPLMRNLEVVGLRLIQSSSQKVEMKFVLVNHSPGAIGDINAKVRLLAEPRGGQETVVGECLLKAGELGPFESKEFTAPLSTDKKAYELPDWQFLRATLEAVKK